MAVVGVATAAAAPPAAVWSATFLGIKDLFGSVLPSFCRLISAAEKTERQSRIISVLECLEKEDEKKRGWKFETVSGGGGAEIRGQR